MFLANLTQTADLVAGLWIILIVCLISVIFPTLLYWTLLVGRNHDASNLSMPTSAQ